MDHRAHLNKKFGNMKYQHAKLDDSFAPGLEDKATKVQHLIAEPNSDNVSVDSELCFSKENPWKHLEIEDFYYGLDFDLKRNIGGLDYFTQGQNELELGVLDGFLDEINEVDDIHAANDISGACEDFLLDLGLADKICNLDYAPSGRSYLENSVSESQSPGLSGSSNGVLGLSESSTAMVLQSECKNVSVEREVVKCGLHEPAVEKTDKKLAGYNELTTPLDLQRFDELDDARPLDSGMFYEIEKKAIHTCKVDTHVGQKRSRRPTKRYAEEFSNSKSNALVIEQGLNMDPMNECLSVLSQNEFHPIKEDSLGETITQDTPEMEDYEKLSELKFKCVSGRRKISSFVPMDKRVKLGFKNEHHHLRSPDCSPFDEAITETSQEPCNSHPRRRRPKKLQSVSVFSSDDEESEYDSEDERVKRKSKKCCDRRKHQRMWTLSEVTRLIDGIAQYGTGRWTDIKKLSFSSSTHRTPIDLRDKWRNLLRASSANKQKSKQNKKEDEVKVKNAMRTLPKNVIRRIRELAILHPYPRFAPGGRYIRSRKN